MKISRFNRILLSLGFLLISLILFGFQDYSNPYLIYYVLNICLLAYVSLIIYKIWKVEKSGILLHPLALSLFFNFLFFGGGITNFFLINDDFSFNSKIISNFSFASYYYVKAGILVNFSAVSLVFGYYSKLGRKLRDLLTRQFFNFGSYELKLKAFFLIILLLLGYYIKIVLMKNGLYGRLLDPSYIIFDSGSSFLASQLAPLSNVSLIPFVIICFHYFKYGSYTWLFYMSLALEFSFAFLEAARGPVMAVFLIVFIVRFYATQTVNIKWVLYGPLILFFAFSTVHDFKNYILENNITKGNPMGLINGFINSSFSTSISEEDESLDSFYQKSLGRMNYINEMSAAIAYKDEKGLQESAPPFLNELLQVPINTFIPRSVQGVANTNWGNWFRYSVLNRGSHDTTYSIAFSPLAFFYFIGGFFAVFIGFVGYGILLRSIEDLPKLGFSGFLLFVLVGSTIIVFKTAVPQILVSYFRLIIFIPLFLKFLPKNLSFLK